MFQTPTPGPSGASPQHVDDNEDEVAYADADYKDIYEFGPVSYKKVSQEAATRKKAEIAKQRAENASRFSPILFSKYSSPSSKSIKKE